MNRLLKLGAALALTAAITSPANAFINPRAVGTLLPDPSQPGYAMLRIDVIGWAWRCAGRVKMENGKVPEQTIGMECIGMAKSAAATIRPKGQLSYRVDYKLNIGIRGHIELI